MKLSEPVRISAILDNGIRFDCAFKFDCWQSVTSYHPAFGSQRSNFRAYRVQVEVPWERIPNVKRFDIVGWPDDVTFVFDVPGMSEGEAQKWAAAIEFNDVAPPIRGG